MRFPLCEQVEIKFHFCPTPKLFNTVYDLHKFGFIWLWHCLLSLRFYSAVPQVLWIFSPYLVCPAKGSNYTLAHAHTAQEDEKSLCHMTNDRSPCAYWGSIAGDSGAWNPACSCSHFHMHQLRAACVLRKVWLFLVCRKICYGFAVALVGFSAPHGFQPSSSLV